MDVSSIFTRTRLGIDNRVWIALIASTLLSGVLFGFRVATTTACSDITIATKSIEHPNAITFYQNDALTFTAKANGAKSVTWDFGDNSIGKGTNAIHGFAAAGTYYVTAIVNEKCREFIPVIIRAQLIKAAPIPVGGTLVINGQDAPKAGEPVNYYTPAVGQAYEWNVLNSPNYATQRSAVATYTFTTAGAKTIELKVDGKVVRKDIQILPGEVKAPEPLPVQKPLPGPSAPAPDPTPEPPKAPKAKILPAEEFTSMLEKVTKGDMNASSFDPYLCEGGAPAIRVLLNDKTWSNLSAFCEKISKSKKYDIKNTQVIRDDAGCVKQLKIKYCKWVTLGLKCKEE